MRLMKLLFLRNPHMDQKMRRINPKGGSPLGAALAGVVSGIGLWAGMTPAAQAAFTVVEGVDFSRACRHWLKFRGRGHLSLKFPVIRPSSLRSFMTDFHRFMPEPLRERLKKSSQGIQDC